jgi:hypothetical protein
VLVRRTLESDDKEGTVQYLLLIYDDEQTWAGMSDDERGQIMQEYFAYTEDLQKSGKMLNGNALQPTQTAKTVQAQNGGKVVTDGPFAETKEQLGGYYLVEVDSEDEALEWAAKIPSARYGKIEVRPIVDFSGSTA